jgi:hypothetical protein
MADIIGICNQALMLLAEKTIQSLEEDTNEARACAVFYPDSRNSCLREIKPNFAVKRSAVLPGGPKPEYEYGQSAVLPQDCGIVLSTWQKDDPVKDWVIENGLLLSGYVGVQIRYISIAEDMESRMDSAFVKAFAASLAAELTYTLTSAASKLAAMMALYKLRKDEAQNQYGQEVSTRQITNNQLTAYR